MARKNKNKAEVESVRIKSFMDMIAPSVIKFFPDYFICGNTYRSVWALREYPTTTEEQAILKHLGEKDGVSLKIYTRSYQMRQTKTACGRAKRMTCRKLLLQRVICRM